MSISQTEFFFNTPIYSQIIIDDSNVDLLQKIIIPDYSRDFEGYNPDSKIDSTFIIYERPNNGPEHFLKYGGIDRISIKCKRDEQRFYFFLFWDPEKKILMKVGQLPSVADFHISQIKQYNKLLSKEKQKEFTRAIGLAANGVGIGSFVYLRRIFEYLIEEAYKAALSETAVTVSEFQTARMDEKIGLLSKYLPPFLVENRSMYSILSLGIHALEEKDCLAYFDTLRVGIEIILDEKLEELNKKEKIENAKKKISEAKAAVKKPKDK
jgi:hypothetical protein